jgi:hypothetical protein
MTCYALLTGNGAWLDKEKQRCLVLWKKVGEWADTIYSWARSVGMEDGVTTVEELSSGDDVKDTGSIPNRAPVPLAVYVMFLSVYCHRVSFPYDAVRRARDLVRNGCHEQDLPMIFEFPSFLSFVLPLSFLSPFSSFLPSIFAGLTYLISQKRHGASSAWLAAVASKVGVHLFVQWKGFLVRRWKT